MIASAYKSINVSAVVYRANGVVEDLGIIAYYHKNPMRRWLWRVKKLAKR